MRTTFACLLLLVSCNTAPSAVSHIPFDLAPVRSLLWSGEEEEALQELHLRRWSLSGDVAAERVRQDIRLGRGERPQVLEELEDWQQSWPSDPDLAYLQARILEDPVHRRDRFRSLVRQYPSHAWIRFGGIATAQQLGDWARAEDWLASPTAGSIEPPLMRLLAARQAQNLGDLPTAFSLLGADAFEQNLEGSLNAYLRVAQEAEDGPSVQRVLAHMALLRAEAASLQTGEAIDLAFARLVAEWPWCRAKSLDQILEDFDAWLELARAPSGWATHPRYSLAGVAQLVRPESLSGGVAEIWSGFGRTLLAGSAWGRGTELHLLQDVRTLTLPWPGHKRPMEILLAQRVTSTAGHTAQGGTVFRGYYILLDSLERGGDRLQGRVLRYAERSKDDAVEREPSGRMESLDLPHRLRLAQLGASSLELQELELVHLSLHEAGHLEEILSWLDFGLPVGELFPAMLASRQRYGDPILWLEYRAQLRAMASGRIPKWIFAEILERGQDPSDPYFRPYRRILRDLLELAEESQWGHLSTWDKHTAEEFVALARRLCAREGIALLPEQGVERILGELLQTDLLEHMPADRSPTDEVDQG